MNTEYLLNILFGFIKCTINSISITIHTNNHIGFISATHIYDNTPALTPNILCRVFLSFFIKGIAPQNANEAIVAKPKPSTFSFSAYIIYGPTVHAIIHI